MKLRKGIGNQEPPNRGGQGAPPRPPRGKRPGGCQALEGPLFLSPQCFSGRTGIEPSPFKDVSSPLHIYVRFQNFPKLKILSMQIAVNHRSPHICHVRRHLEVVGGLRFENSHNYEEWLIFL